MELEGKQRPMICDSQWDIAPFYEKNELSFRILKGPNVAQNLKIQIEDTVQSVYRRFAFNEARRISRFFLWVVVTDLKTNDFILLDSLEWGCTMVVDDLTVYYKMDGPIKEMKIRIPNCLYFPHIANEGYTFFKDDAQKVSISKYPNLKLLEDFVSPPINRNLNGDIESFEYLKLGYKTHPLNRLNKNNLK